MSLHDKLTRLAAEKPSLRGDLAPLLKQADTQAVLRGISMAYASGAADWPGGSAEDAVEDAANELIALCQKLARGATIGSSEGFKKALAGPVARLAAAVGARDY